MASTTSIEWTEMVWNPVTGCDRTSPGCDNCYALAMAKRLKAMGSARYQRDGSPRTSGPGFAITEHWDLIDTPRRWKKPRIVFLNSMSDLFHPDVTEPFIRAVFHTMNETPQHTYQVLTKRSRRLATIAPTLDWTDNIWIGTSVETNRYLYRLNDLRSVPAATRFLSAEPLLGPLPSLDLDGIHWVIVGGESGPNARPINPDWVRTIRDQTVEAGTAFFFKQWGGPTPKANGRTLDGTVWDQYPHPADDPTLPHS